MFSMRTQRPPLRQQHPRLLLGDGDWRCEGGHAGEVAAGTSLCQLPPASRGLFFTKLLPRVSFRTEKSKTNTSLIITVVCGPAGVLFWTETAEKHPPPRFPLCFRAGPAHSSGGNIHSHLTELLVCGRYSPGPGQWGRHSR